MNTQLTKSEIIERLKAEKPFLSRNFGVVNIGLFGSFAKERQRDDSDIDLIVEMIQPRFEWMAGLQVYLEKKFNHRIEIVRKSGKRNSRFNKRIEKEIIYA